MEPPTNPSRGSLAQTDGDVLVIERSPPRPTARSLAGPPPSSPPAPAGPAPASDASLPRVSTAELNLVDTPQHEYDEQRAFAQHVADSRLNVVLRRATLDVDVGGVFLGLEVEWRRGEGTQNQRVWSTSWKPTGVASGGRVDADLLGGLVQASDYPAKID